MVSDITMLDIWLIVYKKYKHRPLLNVEDPKQKIRSMMAKRAPFYAKADHCIDTGKFTVKQVVDNIIGIVKKETKQEPK